jgi:hypothetical protein
MLTKAVLARRVLLTSLIVRSGSSSSASLSLPDAVYVIIRHGDRTPMMNVFEGHHASIEDQFWKATIAG